MRLSLLVLAAIVATALSGCIQTDADAPVEAASALDAPKAQTGAGQLAEAVLAPAPVDLDAPVWELGDAWTMKSYGFGDSTCTLPVVAVGSVYTIASTCESDVIADIVFDVSFIGPIRVDDLAGAQNGVPVRFYDFPLFDGKTWATQWDGRDVVLTATAANVRSPVGTSPGFTIRGVDETGAEYVTYDYSPDIKWFTHLAFADGYGGVIESFKPNWTGTYLTSTGEKRLDAASPAAGALLDTSTFSVGPDSTHLIIHMSGFSPSFVYTLEVLAPDQSVAFRDAGGSPTPAPLYHYVTLPAMPGDWGVSVKAAYDPTGANPFFLRAFDVTVAENVL